MADDTTPPKPPPIPRAVGDAGPSGTRRNALIAAGAAAVVTAGLGIFFWPGKQRPNLKEDELASMLPDIAQLNSLMDADAMVITAQVSEAADPPVGLARPECVGVVDANMKTAYNDSGFSAIHAYVAREPGNTLFHFVSAAVALFGDKDGAGAYVENAENTWKSCSDQEIWTATEPPYPWFAGAVEGTAPNIRISATRDAWLPSCQRVLQTAANVVIDVKTCAAEPGGQAQALADEIAARIDEKTSR